MELYEGLAVAISILNGFMAATHGTGYNRGGADDPSSDAIDSPLDIDIEGIDDEYSDDDELDQEEGHIVRTLRAGGIRGVPGIRARGSGRRDSTSPYRRMAVSSGSGSSRKKILKGADTVSRYVDMAKVEAQKDRPYERKLRPIDCITHKEKKQTDGLKKCYCSSFE